VSKASANEMKSPVIRIKEVGVYDSSILIVLGASVVTIILSSVWNMLLFRRYFIEGNFNLENLIKMGFYLQNYYARTKCSTQKRKEAEEDKGQEV
jgi:hypothetical protein